MAKNVIKVQSVKPANLDEFDSKKILSTFCYYFQQYTYEQARQLPYKTVKLMLRTALEQKTYDSITQIHINNASQTVKGSKSMIKQLQGELNG